MARYEERECPKHGLTVHRKRKGRNNSYRCLACYREKRKANRIHKKNKLVKQFGGKCIKCGYDSLPTLQFHHTNPTKKEGNVFTLLYNKSFKAALKEAEKCILVCANCHCEIHEELGKV